jgi:NADH-quinone oxidoreductase subunit C
MAAASRSIEELSGVLSEACGNYIVDSARERGDLIITVLPKDISAVLHACKQNPQLGFNLLVDITAVDWMDQRKERFEVVYQLLSIPNRSRLTIKVPVSEDSPEVASATSLWSGASFLEREVWDMFGIRFSGHPDLRRILMYEEFVGHPLRKDYPVQGKQPRIPLRGPEVENTARRMIRPDLVTIRPRVAASDASGETGVLKR